MRGRAPKCADRVFEIDDALESIIEHFESRRWTDGGLPFVPPTPERVAAMVRASGRTAHERIAVLPPGHGAATVERIGSVLTRRASA